MFYDKSIEDKNREKIMFNPKSHKAEEFINHEEVLASLEYAKITK